MQRGVCADRDQGACGRGQIAASVGASLDVGVGAEPEARAFEAQQASKIPRSSTAAKPRLSTTRSWLPIVSMLQNLLFIAAKIRHSLRDITSVA